MGALPRSRLPVPKAWLFSTSQALHCQISPPRSSNKIASSSSAMSRSKSRRLTSGRSRSPCHERKNKEKGLNSISEKRKWIQETVSERHATRLGQGSPGAQAPGAERGEMEMETPGLGQREVDARGLGYQNQVLGLRLCVQGDNSPRSVACVWAPLPGG